jgi:predicted DCC family thiol-disulfide oxidoreductase YuxK
MAQLIDPPGGDPAGGELRGDGDAHPPRAAWIVLYDADCGFCMWLLSALLRWDRHGRLRPLALQSAEAEKLLADLAPAERIASWHLISPAAQRSSGGAALAVLLRLLPGGRPAGAVLARLPRLTEAGYRWVAAHRTGLSRWVPSSSKRRGAQRVHERESR